MNVRYQTHSAGSFVGTAHSPTDAPHPRLAAAYGAWLNAPKVAGLPPRREIALEQVPDAVGQIGIVDVLPDDGFRYRLFGSGLVAAIGYDATGWTTDQLRPPEYANVITAQYRQVVEERHPILHEIRTKTPKENERRYFRLTAPLTLSDGRVDQLWLTVAMLGSFGNDVFDPDDSPILPSWD